MTKNSNQPISTLTKEDIKDIKIICFDTDGVTVKRGTEIEEKGQEIRIKTSCLEPDMLSKMLALKKRFHVTVNSGRSSLYLTKMYIDLLWDNASIISENGVFILRQGHLTQNFDFNDYELATLRSIYSQLRKVADNHPDARGFEPKQFIITLHCFHAIPEVDQIVKKYDTKKEFYCWWNGEAYDIAPHRFNKGLGLAKLCQLLNVDLKQSIAIGNGINDKDMMDAAGISITTDKEHLKADFYVEGEHLGGETLTNRLLELIK